VAVTIAAALSLDRTGWSWVDEAAWADVAPVAVPVNVLVLGPLALAGVYGMARRLCGPIVAGWTGLAWIAAPYAAAVFWTGEVRELYVEEVLPLSLGLSPGPELPALAALAAAGALLLHALPPVGGDAAGTWQAAVLAGTAVGAAVAILPASVLFVAGAAGALAVARASREALAFAAALAPWLLLVALWRWQALGRVGPEVDLAWGHWADQMSNLREFSLSARLSQWAPLAGVLALVLLRRFAGAALLAGWLGAFLAVTVTDVSATIEGGGTLPPLLPAFPAYVVLAAAVPLLVPTLARRLGLARAPSASGDPVALA
jgi:hypothetical protein